MRHSILVVLIFLNSVFSFAKEFYVAPSGKDSNDGSFEKPLETIKRAQELAISGDTVFIRGGKYVMREDQISQQKRIWTYVTLLDKDGISYLAYKNEKPLFDYTNVKPQGKRVIAFLVSGNRIHLKGLEITGVQVTIKTHTQSECFEVQGSSNTLEQLDMHDNMAIGIYMLSGSNNLILNCDAHDNWDSVSEGGKGGNTDGFGCHLQKGSVNNVFRGCRAWFNSDDGFDLISNAEPVLIENCWAFYNGYSKGFVGRADGNGFKAGGYGKGKRPYQDIVENYTPIPRNTIRFCLAVRNKQSGFYANHHLEGNFWYNNTAYKNRRNYNMVNGLALNPIDFGTDGPGWNHELINNIGFNALSEELTDIDTSRCVLKNNSFNLNFKVNASDFESIDENFLISPRQADGSLPETKFLKLKPTSKLIDAGIDIGFPFLGKAPDLGCFERK